MKILIEALGIHRYGGGRTATLNLLHNLLACDPHTQYRLLLTRLEPGLLARNLQPFILPIENRFLARVAAQALLPRFSLGCDLIHFAKNLGLVTSKPYLVTLYDLTTLSHPALVPKIDTWYWRWLQPQTMKGARKIIAISQTTARDARTHLGVAAEKIAVIYPTVGAHFQAASPPAIAETRRRYALPEKYILYVGRIDKKNNLRALISAFAQLNTHSTLVIVGPKDLKNPPLGLEQHIEQLDLTRQVYFTGALPDEALPALYSGAQVVVMPSLHEGFGLVAAEALACGAALVAGRVGALPEITAGGARLVAEPTAAQLADALDRLLTHPAEIAALKKAARAVGARYRTQQDARQTLTLYRKQQFEI